MNSSQQLRHSTEVIGNDAAIEREFDRIERASQPRTTRLEAAYMQFVRIAQDCDATVDDVISAQTKSPSAAN